MPLPHHLCRWMRRLLFLCLVLIFQLVLLQTTSTVLAAEAKNNTSQKTAKLSLLIIDGQNNHNWQKTTPVLKKHLEATGRFAVSIATSPKRGEDMRQFNPKFSEYDVVLSNYNGERWGEKTEAAFTKYILAGGAFVCVHAANNSFPEWHEYNEMTGLGGWYGRTEKSGPYVYLDKTGKVIRDKTPGKGGHHGPQRPFTVKIWEPEHPITRGMPTEWLHTKDELYDMLRGPANRMTILATAYADSDKGGSGHQEPMMMTLTYGKGRIFHTPMGHANYSLNCVGFTTTLTRGAEWAATGKVTIPIPENFPTKEKTSSHQKQHGKIIKTTSLKNKGKIPQWVTYPSGKGPGAGKHIVLISGDEEYRSEEALPQLGKILSTQHGFRCTVLFAIDPKSGQITPTNQNNIPGLEHLEKADLMIIATRFRDLPDHQMKQIVDYVQSGRPILGLRTATHAFNIKKNKTYAEYGFRGGKSGGGFGRAILGETWISHHGHHAYESTRGLLSKEAAKHPILRGIGDGDIWGPTDVYTVKLPMKNCTPLIVGQVLKGMKIDSKPLTGKKNNPMMPIAWTRLLKQQDGSSQRVFTTTMGAATDLQSEGLRRLIVNAVYWAVKLEEKIPAKNSVQIVGDYQPSDFGFGRFHKGTYPADHQLKK